MNTILYQKFTVTGQANLTIYDGGITSTDAEKKKVISIIVSTSGQVGNDVQLWLEREKKADIPDFNLDTVEASGTNIYKSTNKINELPVDLEIPVGQTLKVAIKCGGTLKSLYGAYKYEVV